MRLPDRVLFVGAHCDDIELLAGGLLARCCFDGHTRVGVLVFSDHRGVVDDSAADLAREEFAGNLRWLAAESGRGIQDHSATMMPACQGEFETGRGRLYAALEALRDDYDMVVTHAVHDTNQDHRQVAQEAIRVFKAHATVLGGEFPNNDLGDDGPRLYVELSDRALAAKVKMIGAYASQRFGGRPYLDESVIRALATLRGSQIRSPSAEAFTVSARAIVRMTGDRHR